MGIRVAECALWDFFHRNLLSFKGSFIVAYLTGKYNLQNTSAYKSMRLMIPRSSFCGSSLAVRRTN